MPRHLISNLLGFVGALIGGAVGFYTFDWLRGQGYYGLIIPGAFMGLGCSLLAQHGSPVRGIVCAVAALGLGLYTEWRFWPFLADGSFSYFLKSAPTLKPVTLLMLGVGALIAFWVGGDSGYSRLGAGGPDRNTGAARAKTE